MSQQFILEFSQSFCLFASKLLGISIQSTMTFDSIKDNLRFIFNQLNQIDTFELYSIQEFQQMIDLYSYYDLKFISNLKYVYVYFEDQTNDQWKMLIKELYGYDLLIIDVINYIRYLISLLELNYTITNVQINPFKKKIKEIETIYYKISIFENNIKLCDNILIYQGQQLQHLSDNVYEELHRIKSHIQQDISLLQMKFNYMSNILNTYIRWNETKIKRYYPMECIIIGIIPFTIIQTTEDFNHSLLHQEIPIQLLFESSNYNDLKQITRKNLKRYNVCKLKISNTFEFQTQDKYIFILLKTIQPNPKKYIDRYIRVMLDKEIKMFL